MTIIQSKTATGAETPPRPQSAGAVHVAKATIALTSGVVAASDIIELAVLPAFARIVDAVLIPENGFGAITADVGLMSGAVGDTGARTCGAELFDDAALAGPVRMSLPTGFLLPPAAIDRSIGVKLSADVAAGTKKLTLLLSFAQ